MAQKKWYHKITVFQIVGVALIFAAYYMPTKVLYEGVPPLLTGKQTVTWNLLVAVSGFASFFRDLIRGYLKDRAIKKNANTAS